MEELEASIKRRLTRLLREFEADLQRRAEHREASRMLEFPHPDLRPGQERILEAVDTRFEQGEHLLLEAPTGIGKTVAALYPALRYALANDKKVFVLTAKNLQQEMATAVLEMLNLDDRFHSLQLRAKARMCANEELICHEEYCPYARDYYMKLQSSAVSSGCSSPAAHSCRNGSSTWRARPRSVPSRSAWKPPGNRRSSSATTTTPSTPMWRCVTSVPRRTSRTPF